MQKRSLLLTLRNDPALPSLLNTLPAAALARLVERVGLNDAGELMELTPARKLLQALDESVWKSPAPGRAGSASRPARARCAARPGPPPAGR